MQKQIIWLVKSTPWQSVSRSKVLLIVEIVYVIKKMSNEKGKATEGKKVNILAREKLHRKFKPETGQCKAVYDVAYGGRCGWKLPVFTGAEGCSVSWLTTG